MKKILIAACADASTNPRPNRMIRFLKEKYDICYLGTGSIKDKKIHFIPLPSKTNNVLRRVNKLVQLKCGKYEDFVRYDNQEKFISILKGYQFDAIVCHDLLLLPLLSKINNGEKIIFDAREYYPRHFEDRLLWKFLYQGLNEYLCEKYLGLPHYSMTVSQGLADEYLHNYGVKMDVMLSLPREEKCKPSDVDPDHIRMIYHGNAHPSRQIEVMIQVMDYVDKRFSLDLMMVGTHSRYYRKLEKIVQQHPNVHIIPPVSFSKIICETNKYDVGLYFCLPSSFNVKYMMPNKLFEFVQARLGVAIGPSPDMKNFVEQQGVGIVAEEFTPRSMASALNKLSTSDIIEFKQKSNKVSREFNASANKKKALDLIKKVL